MTAVPPPPPMAMPPMPGAPGGTSKNWMGITALILGIVGFLISCCGFFGLLLPAGAIVLGLLSKNAEKAGEATNGKLGNVGFILGIVGVVFALGWGIFGIVAGGIDWASYTS